LAASRICGVMDYGDECLVWARRCRVEAARAIHPRTKEFLLELALHFEASAGEKVALHPDDSDLQSAVGDRLSEMAARFRIGSSQGPADDSVEDVR
jgi:hypothetical protein